VTFTARVKVHKDADKADIPVTLHLASQLKFSERTNSSSIFNKAPPERQAR
jgi:hypothetical protein